MVTDTGEDVIEPRLTLPGVEVYIGDALETVLQLASKYGGKVNTIITSPPYFNLRDYGTATWEGGDPACDHKPSSTLGRRGIASSTLGGGKETTGHQREGFKSQCRRCGARRIDEQIGLEDTVEQYVNRLADLFDAIGEHLLRPDGSLWINLGDSYAGSGGAGGDYNPGGLREGQPKWKTPKTEWPAKSLMLVPEQFALEMIRRGWILRNRVAWFKGKDMDDLLDDDDGGAPASNGMPSSAEDRLKNTHEVVFHFVRQQRYFYDLDAIREPLLHPEAADGTRLFGGKNKHQGYGTRTHSGKPYGRRAGTVPLGLEDDPTKGQPSGVAGSSPLGRNPGDVWAIPTAPFPLAHFATFPPALVHRPVKATCPVAICIKCGVPRTMIYESTGVVTKREPTHTPNNTPTKVDSTGWAPANRSTGNLSDCGCEAGWTGGIVLDPFFGSGATAQGAFEARPPKTIDGHSCQPLVIGIDLDERNLEIVEKRLTGRAKQSRKVDLSKYGGGLFALEPPNGEVVEGD
jgi:DNA modification methylase